MFQNESEFCDCNYIKTVTISNIFLRIPFLGDFDLLLVGSDLLNLTRLDV